MGVFRQFWLLVHKNYILQKRRPIATLFEIGLPTFFFIILIVTRKISLSHRETRCDDPLNENQCHWPAFDVNSIGFQSCAQWDVAFSPMTAQPVITNLNVTDLLPGVVANFQGFDTETAAVNWLLAKDKVAGCRVGLIFQGLAPSYQVALRMDYTPGGYDPSDNNVRTWLTGFAFPDFEDQGPRKDGQESADRYGNYPGYWTYGFLGWQHAVNSAILRTETPSPEAHTVMASVQLQRFPFPQYIKDGFLYAIQFGMPLLLMLALFFTALSITRNIVHEKERRLKESMKMMGLRNWIHWAAWFTEYFLFLSISTVIMAIELGAGNVLQKSDVTLIFVFLLLFAVATISFCFMLSVFFSKASSAAAGAGIIWFLSYFPYFFISQRYDQLSFSAKQMSCLISTTCMALGMNVVSTQEANGVGVTWENYMKAISVDDTFSFGTVLGMLIFDALFYAIITWYVEAVFPGQFGIPRPFYFPFQKSYWCGTTPERIGETTPLLERNPKRTVDADKFETEPEGLPCGIRLDHLRKVFDKKVAVRDTSLSMYEGQITALLGHNGAGKTTTMSMLTGLFPPTSGAAVIMGHDINTDTAAAQRSLGLCPQHDVLFDSLTVEEHLIFFCKLKDVPSREVPRHVDEMIRDLQLEEKRHAQAKTLSGGQKRRLSCGIALVGGSKVVVLDEPTSGMDPSARRATWDLLLRHKEGRTILLSTHFMDEADVLGDRIAIMSEGVVCCCGSSLFLKQIYGVGYQLTMVKQPGCNPDAVLTFLKTHVPETLPQSNIGVELSFLLPWNTAPQFERMFTSLDARLEELHIESYGISVTTMEEVFLKVGERRGDDEDERVDVAAKLKGREINGSPSLQPKALALHGHDGHAASSTEDDDDKLLESRVLIPAARERNTGMTLKLQQFRAMIVKRILHSKRNRMAVFTQLLPPLLFTLIALIVTRTFPPPADSPARSLSSLTDVYGDNVAYYTTQWPDGTTNAVATLLGRGLQKVIPQVGGQLLQEMPIGVNATPPYSNSQEFILDQYGPTTATISEFNNHVAVLLQFYAHNAEANITGFFNGQGYHAVAQALAAIDAAVVAAYVPAVSVSNINFPLPRSDIEEAKSQQNDQTGFNLAFSIVFGMAPLAASFVLFLVTERSNNAKHVQFVSGVNAYSYWGSTFLWDYVNYLIPVTGCIILFAAFSIDAFSNERMGYVVLLFVLYGPAVIPLMYLATHLFKTPSVAFTRLTMFNIVTGLAAMLTVMLLQIIDPPTGQTLKAAFLFLPNYCFGQAISDVYQNYQQQLIGDDADFCLTLDPPCQPNYLAWDAPGIGRYVTFLVIQAVVLSVTVILVERRVFSSIVAAIQRVFDKRSAQHALEVLTHDVDVVAERARVREIVQSGRVDSEALLVQDLTKVFHTGVLGTGKHKIAVNSVSVGIPHGECFGLLGVNGAGKTTTFRMLTGDENMTAGTAFLAGHNIRTHMSLARQYIGYCPQFDALIDLLTGREVLTMFARLRGVPEFAIPSVVTQLIHGLMLEKHADKFTKDYSGGNKRKLSTAIALVGDPPIVFLDEPTTGMDPGARRFLWNALLDVVRAGRAVILTSHSMEECEALCTRLAIMVNGQFQCLGSPQHLKSRFGQGVTITAKVPYGTASVDPIKQFIERSFPSARLKEEHMGTVRYVVDGHGIGQLFGVMERAKTELGLDSYSVSQATLEQIFLEFARLQRPEETNS